MSLDISALRAKLNKMKGRSQRSEAFWRPEAGEQIIRIVPWNERPENPFVELYFHYLGGKTQLSPLSNGNPDPLQELADDLRSDGTKESYQKAREFMAKIRTHAPVIVRGEEDKGVRWYAFGKTVYQALLKTIADPDYGDITDPETGRDVVVEYTPQEKSDTNFAKTTIRVKPNQTPLSDDPELAEEWLNDQPNIKDLFDEPSYDELVNFLRRYLQRDEEGLTDMVSVTESVTNDEDEDEDETVSVGSDSSGTSSALDEFEQMFEND